MSNALTLSGYSPSQLALIKNTVARDTNDQEFSLFIEAARAYGLDAFRRQISCVVFNKTNAAKRQMAIIVARDGLRLIAERCGNYRPASDAPKIEHDEALKGPTNPKGIVRATVTLFRQDRDGVWWPVVGVAEWDEFAATKAEWAEGEDQKRRPTGNVSLEDNWARMPTLMISKCAESQALRAGWPDQFGGLYAEEELHKAATDMTASEMLAVEEENQRAQRIGGRGISFVFDLATGVLESVPVGSIADRCMAFINGNDTDTVKRWANQNRASLAQFWTSAPSDALEVKKAMESKVAA